MPSKLPAQQFNRQPLFFWWFKIDLIQVIFTIQVPCIKLNPTFSKPHVTLINSIPVMCSHSWDEALVEVNIQQPEGRGGEGGLDVTTLNVTGVVLDLWSWLAVRACAGGRPTLQMAGVRSGVAVRACAFVCGRRGLKRGIVCRTEVAAVARRSRQRRRLSSGSTLAESRTAVSFQQPQWR